MIHLEFLELYIKNFNSIETMTFPIVPGKHLVVAPNGSGKSSIFESLPYALFKTYLRDKNPSRDYRGDCMVGVNFKRGDSTYLAKRYYQDKNRGSMLEVFIDGENISPRKSKSTEEELQALIGIPSDTFISTVVILQGLPINFSALTPTARKNIIEDLLGFQIWDELKDKFTGKMRFLKIELDTAKSNLSALRSTHSSSSSRLKALTEVESKRSIDFQEKIANYKHEISGAYHHIDKIKQEILSTFKETKSDLSLAKQDQYSKIRMIKSDIQNFKGIIDKKICSACNQNYPEDKIKEAEAKLTDLTGLVSSQAELLMETEVKLKSYEDLESSIRKMENEITVSSRAMNQLQVESEKNYSEEIATLLEQVTLLESQIADAADTTSKVSDSADGVDYINGLLVPSSKFRTRVLENYLTYINSIIASITPVIFADLIVKLAPDVRGNGVEIEITRGEKGISYKSLSGGEKRRLDIILILSFQRFLLESSGISTNLLVFDEIFDALDDAGVQGVLNCIDTIFPESSSIYVITHKESIKSMFSSVIRVLKENSLTRVEAYNDHS